MSIPTLDPALQAVVDGEQVDIREMLADNIASARLLMERGPREIAHLEAVDLLARLAGIADQPVERQLLVAVARLHAWLEETR